LFVFQPVTNYTTGIWKLFREVEVNIIKAYSSKKEMYESSAKCNPKNEVLIALEVSNNSFLSPAAHL